LKETTVTRAQEAAQLENEWETNPRWQGIERSYSAADVISLRGNLREQHTLARVASEKLWGLLGGADYVKAMTGGQAVQMVKAGLSAIYVSGWQIAGDANLAEQVYPDQSLYPANSAPALVRRINNALRRADQVAWAEGDESTDWFVPILADGEAGFGGALNVYELTKAFIEAGTGGVHFEDQLAAEKKCGHMGGKVLVPTAQQIRTLSAARLAADVSDVPLIIVARTDANGANLLTSDVDPRDQRFCTGERTGEGFYRVRPGLEQAVDRAISYAPYADMLWCETAKPDLDEARSFAEQVHERFPDKMLAYNCSPSFNWRRHLDEATIGGFQKELAGMGYRFQFITLAGFHALNLSMFDLAREYAEVAMPAYVRLQEREFALEADGYTATRHQREVGAGYFDRVSEIIAGGNASTLALKGSTEEAQF
jgi:isocitrate lyase